MNHVNIITSLALLLLVISCKQEPSTTGIIDFKHTDNTVRVRLEGSVKNVLPLYGSLLYESAVNSQIYNYLINYNPVSNEFEPELIKEIPSLKTNEADAIGTYSYTFEILEEAQWADGSPVTAKDFIVTLKSIFNPLQEASIRTRAILTGEFNDVVTYDTNPKKFTIFFDNLSVQSLETFTNVTPVMPAAVLDPGNTLDAIPLVDLLNPNNADRLADNAILQEQEQRLSSVDFLRDLENLQGSGPYTLTSWETEQQLVLTRKTNWWGDQISKETHWNLNAYPDQLIYLPLPEPNAAYAAIKSEDLDASNKLPEASFEELKSESGDKYDFLTVNAARVYFLAINTRRPKLAQKEVRQAIAYALDIDEVLNTVYNGYGQRTSSPVYPTQDEFNSDLEVIQQNIDKAKSLLKEAGWEDSNNDGIVDKEIDGERVELSLQYVASPSSQSKNTGLLFQSHAKLAGIDLQVDQQALGDYFTSLRSVNFDIISTGTSITPIWNPRQSWHTEGQNRPGFGNAESDALIEKIVSELDKEKRNDMCKELQVLIADQQPVIFLHVPKTTIAVHKRFDYDVFEWFEGFEPRWFKLKEAYKGLSQN